MAHLVPADKNKINVEMEMLSWIKYHNQLQSTNNILCVCLSQGFLKSVVSVAKGETLSFSKK